MDHRIPQEDGYFYYHCDHEGDVASVTNEDKTEVVYYEDVEFILPA